MPKLFEELRSKREKIYEIASEYGVSNIRVFGSVARGEEREDSDVDLLVNIDYKKYGSGFARVDFKEKIEKYLKHKVDILTEKSLYYPIKKEVMKGLIPL